MINYYELGKSRQINQIVFAGTHDAGITSGGSGVQTQNLDIGEQATAGVRFFDIRIAAAITSEKHETGRPVAELRAFHADDKVVFKFDRTAMLKGDPHRMSQGGQQAIQVKQSKLAGGAFGLALVAMLQQARNFVHSDIGKTEFLMLKFDKCTNWKLIAETCVEVLGLALYTGGGNLNTKTLENLAGKVIVLFSSKGLTKLQQASWDHRGILGFKNLSGEGQNYTSDYQGLQYYGKGGTSPFNPSDKLNQNIKKQTKLIQGAAALQNPEVVGMMYWTTTGLIESIKKRDDGMWSSPNISTMKSMWGQCLGDFVDERMTLKSTNALANGQQRRSFFPNIVMIDFADDKKCKDIRELNDLTASQLANV